jgi:hypothetical protein
LHCLCPLHGRLDLTSGDDAEQYRLTAGELTAVLQGGRIELANGELKCAIHHEDDVIWFSFFGGIPAEFSLAPEHFAILCRSLGFEGV